MPQPLAPALVQLLERYDNVGGHPDSPDESQIDYETDQIAAICPWQGWILIAGQTPTSAAVLKQKDSLSYL